MSRIFSCLLLFVCSSIPLLATDWKPVTSADLSLKAPRVDPGADAEALFWEMWIADAAANNQYPYTTYTHYLRIKIFTDRGVKQFGTVDLEYRNKENIRDVAGRTIRPDGSIQELTKDAIFDRIVEKKKKGKVHAVSFAMPGVAVGSIIEYRWRQFDTDGLANYVPLLAYREIPVEHLVYHLKPLNNPYWPYSMRYQPFHVTLPAFKSEAGGWYTSSLDNLAAVEEEADAPPQSETCPWILIYYAEDRKENLDHFWNTEGKRRSIRYKEFLKANTEVKNIAEGAAAGGKTVQDKLRLLDIYCQKNIKDISGDEATDEDRQHFKPNRNSADTLKRGIGTSMDIRLAFAALAISQGFDARVAFLCDRDKMIFHREMMIPFLPETDIAVDVNGKWKVYDVTSRNLEPGQLRWQQEGVSALVTDEKNPKWILTGLTDPALSKYKRWGQLKLDEEGTLERKRLRNPDRTSGGAVEGGEQ